MPARKLSDRQISKLVELYKQPNIKMEELCRKFKVSDDTIVRWVKRKGVPMRVTTGYCDEKNSNWKGGYSLKYAKNMAIRHSKKNECVICGYNTSTDVHHWDGDGRNNRPDNLVLLCPNHHREVHLGSITKENINQKHY